MVGFKRGGEILEKKTLFRRHTFDFAGNGSSAENFDVEYYLLESSDYSSGSESLSKSVYGIEIRKICKGVLQEVSADYGVSTSIDRVKSLIDVLADNSVTPDSLEFIMSDNNARIFPA